MQALGRTPGPAPEKKRMKRELKYFIASRYLRSPKSHSVINIISGVSCVAMAVPVAAIILLLSIFNGLEGMVSEFYDKVEPDLSITPTRGTTFAEDAISREQLLSLEGVEQVSFTLEQNALAEAEQRQTLVSVRGADTHYKQVTELGEIINGTSTLSLDEQDCIVASLGVIQDLSLASNASLGKSITLYAINRKRLSSLLPVGGYTRRIMPITGVISLGEEHHSLLFTSLRAAQGLFNYPDRVSKVVIRAGEGHSLKDVKERVQSLVGEEFRVKTRYESNSLYRLMALEKWGVFAVAMLVMAVASLSIVGTLVMVVIDKREDIETLRTMGARQSLIEAIFIGEGELMALLSLIGGIAVGVGLALVQQHFGIVRLNTQTLMVDAYPIELHLSDVVLTAIAYTLIAWGIIRLTLRHTLSGKNTNYEKSL